MSYVIDERKEAIKQLQGCIESIRLWLANYLLKHKDTEPDTRVWMFDSPREFEKVKADRKYV